MGMERKQYQVELSQDSELHDDQLSIMKASELKYSKTRPQAPLENFQESKDNRKIPYVKNYILKDKEELS